MMKNRKTNLKIIAACSVAIFSLAGLISGSFAWFAMTLQAANNTSSFTVQAGENVDFDLYYLHHFAVDPADPTTNKNGNYSYETEVFSGYELTYANPVFTKVNFDESGTVIDVVDPTSIRHLWPAHRTTYAIVVTSGEHNTFNLFSWSEETSASVVTRVNNQDVRVSLSWAINMFGGAYYVDKTATVTDDIADGFADYIADTSLTDKFTYSQTNIAPEVKPTLNIVDSISGTSGADKRVVLYFSIEFSNDSDTFYTYDDPYYVKSTTGNSNCYEKLRLTNLIFKLV